MWWYLGVQDLLPLWSQVVHDAVDGSFKGDAPDEEDGENDVRERGGEVHHLEHTGPAGQISGSADRILIGSSCRSATDLSGRLDPFEETEEDDHPGQGQAAQDGESHLSQVPDVVGDVENVAPVSKRRLLQFTTVDQMAANHPPQ